MTAPFAIGDRVRPRVRSGRAARPGRIVEIARTGEHPIRVRFDGQSHPCPGGYAPDELEKIDDEMDITSRTTAGAAADVSRSPANDTVDQHAAEHPSGESSPAVAPVAVAPVGPVTALAELFEAVAAVLEHASMQRDGESLVPNEQLEALTNAYESAATMPLFSFRDDDIDDD